MAQEQYQSPPIPDDFHDFRQELMQHDTGTHYASDAYGTDQHSYIHSGTNSGYITPDPNQMLEQTGMPFTDPYANQYEPGAMVGRDVYGHPLYYQHQSQDYYPAAPNRYPSPVPLRYTNSPPTPSASDLSSTGRRKRPTRSRPANDTPKAKRAKPAKSEKAKTPKLDAPLSELTKNSDVPLKDMEAWVNRSTEERLKEVENRPGNKITRPMNSFMLYRSAFADRTKRWCTQNNHQVVSSVSGESWPMEPEEVKNRYTEYARIERDNHQKAHPGYKFSPTKPGSNNRKRKDASEDEEEQSELEDIDGEYMPSSRNRSRRPRQATPEAIWAESHLTPYGYGSNAIPDSLDVHRSSYQYSNPHKPLPAPMVDQGQYGQYYQTMIRQVGNGNIEDVLFQKTEIPGGMSYGTAQALSSVPGGGHHELLDDSFADSPASLNAGTFESKLDPSLANDFGDISSDFENQQLGQDQEAPSLHTYTFSKGTSAPQPPVNFESLGDGANNSYTDEELAAFLTEANGG